MYSSHVNCNTYSVGPGEKLLISSLPLISIYILTLFKNHIEFIYIFIL